MDSYQDFDFPADIRCVPQPLIAFVGLDTLHNGVHKNIWEIFCSDGHTDRLPMEFISLAPDFALPVMKPKRASYEWYIPKGILKTNWVTKHLHSIPSVIVLFCELDWDDGRWSEKKLECASQIHILRTAVEGRNIKLAVVLIQKTINVVSEDNLSTERASELCTACDLNPKSLFLLHNNEHLLGYIVRLESAFHELAQNYYNQQIRNIKIHKDHLNKTSHQYLFVRHQFKIAFFNEMKHDFSTAHKQYTQTNLSLNEVKVTDVNLNEIRTIAAFITYKLCRIYFSLNQPRDAISQFNSHIENFRTKTGPAELLFEHYAWLSKQYEVFGNLFEEATRQGLPAVQTRHPGFYYEQAAQYAAQRKSLLMTKETIEYPNNDHLVGGDKVEYYGQRCWRLNNRSEAADAAKEQSAVVALQYREKHIVNHSALIISYLGNAITQFKMYRSPRKRRYLAVQMADEYYSCKDYRQALTLFTHMLWEYRSDKWWELTIDLLRKALNCAYLTASLQEYIERSLEAAYLFADEEKLRILDNINCVIKNNEPRPEPALLQSDVAAVKDSWKTLMTCTSSVKRVTVEMQSSTSFILCKATFCQANCNGVNLEIWFRNEFPVPLFFSQLSIGIGSHTKNSEYVVLKAVNEDSKTYLQLNNAEIKCIPFSFVPSAADIGSELQLKYVSLVYGQETQDNYSIDLRFCGVCSEADISERRDSHLMLSCKLYSAFARLDSQLAILVQPKVSKLKIRVEQKAPSLIGEWYKMNVFIENMESTAATAACLHVTLSPSFSNQTLPGGSSSDMASSTIRNFTTEIFENIDGAACHMPYVIQLGDLEPGCIVTKSLYFKTNSVDSKNVAFKVVYHTVNVAGEPMMCASEENVQLDCVNAFEIAASFLSCKCEHISRIYDGQSVLMRMQIDCVSPWPVQIEETAFKLLDEQVHWTADQYTSSLRNCVLKNKEIGTEVISFVMKKPPSDEGDACLGSFLIHWKREGGGESDSCSSVVCTEVQLPQMKIAQLPLSLDINISSASYVRKPLPVSLVLRNNSQELMSFDINIEHNEVDAFMFSGCKQTSFNLVPGGRYCVRYNLFPLQAGYVPLPYIKLDIHSDLISQTQVNELVRTSLPSCLFIMPLEKGSSTECSSLPATIPTASS